LFVLCVRPVAFSAMASVPDLKERILGTVAIARLFRKEDGEILEKVLTFVLQLVFMASLTFYAAINSSVVTSVGLGTPAGGIVFLYGIAIGAGWVISLVLLRIVDDRNIKLAGTFPLLNALLILKIVIYVSLLIASIVTASVRFIDAGVLIGYFILVWVLTELLVVFSAFAALKLTKKPRSLEDVHEGDDEYSDIRGTFQGVDAAAALGGASSSSQQEAPAHDDADLGLL
jgi:hypothetical protein